MNEQEWLSSTDARPMLEALWQLYGADEASLLPKLHRYLLACCRRIWCLLPDENSRLGVRVAERYLAGRGDTVELRRACWHCEGGAFNINYDGDPALIQQWIAQTRAIPRHELATLLYPPDIVSQLDTRELLLQAAYFAHFAADYPQRRSRRTVPDSYAPFLSAALLREFFSNPFRARP